MGLPAGAGGLSSKQGVITSFRQAEHRREAGRGAAAGPGLGENPAAVALGRRGGAKGGKVRAAKLTPEQRAEIARKAAAARWGQRERPD